MRLLFTTLSVLMLGIGAVCAQSLHTTDAASDYDRGYTMYCDGNYAGCLGFYSPKNNDGTILIDNIFVDNSTILW